MRKFGLIGFPLSHSFSEKYFREKFIKEEISDAVYSLFPLESIEDLPRLIADNPDLCGLNVTIPYKEKVIPFLNAISKEAEQIGAVNCISISKGISTGYNTDIFGFEQSLIKALEFQPEATFILGTGGSSKAVQFVLKKLKITYHLVSSSAAANSIQYTDVSARMKGSNLFINTTPLGMFPSIDSCPPILYNLLSPSDVLFDLVYNPETSLFLQQGIDKGSKAVNGYEMLKLQAEKSYEIWCTAGLLS